MRPLLIAAVLVLAAAPVLAQPADSHRKAACHGADGQVQPCPRKKGAPKTGSATPMITRCRDITSHQLTRCGGPNAEPVPAN